MKNLSLVAILPMLSLVQSAGAETSTAVLEKRCLEQERQILQLEEENSRLRSLLETGSRMQKADKPSAVEHKAGSPEAPAKPVYYTVAQGDTLSRIARKNGTTTEKLVELNQLKNAALIRLGQKLELPQSEVPVADKAVASKTADASEKVPASPSNGAGTHMVRNGETFFGIARKYGLSVQILADANPDVNPRSIRVGQRLQLVSRETPKPLAGVEKAPSAEDRGSLASSPGASSKTVSNQPLIRSIRIEEEINFGNFAKAHGMEPAKLNALNGLHLEPNTVLAKGSELYVSAQP